MRYTALLPIAAALSAVGCTAARPSLEPVEPRHGLPDAFLVGEVADDECRSPIIDPRDGTELRFVRSSDGEGDYVAPAGRYGLSEGEALRVGCRTGRVLGVIVP